MFFVLSKTVTVFLVPSNLILFVGLAGLVLMATRWRRAGTRLTIASIVLLLIAGATPLGTLLTRSLESRFPPWEKTDGPARGAPDGIVVLGGGISSGLSRQIGTAIVSADGGRVIALAHLARLYPKARIIYSGGDASLGRQQAARGWLCWVSARRLRHRTLAGRIGSALAQHRGERRIQQGDRQAQTG